MINPKQIINYLKIIQNTIDRYTDSADISIYTEQVIVSFNSNDFDSYITECREIYDWYKRNIAKIKTNRFVSDLEAHIRNIERLEKLINDFTNYSDDYINYFKTQGYELEKNKSKQNEGNIINILNRFHKVAKQLSNRHNSRTTIEIDDEYDVQDLLHSLLKIYFDDIIPEEHTPSYAGNSSRVDFIIKDEKIVIEVKNTKKGHTDKHIADELIIDIERYQKHPDCKKLICFIYDKEQIIKNPIRLKKDLEENKNGFVNIVINPLP